MKQYEVTAEFWRHGNLVPVGTKLMLSDREAKYLTHALNGIRYDVPVKSLESARSEIVSILLAEKPVEDDEPVVSDDKPRKRRK